MKTLTKTRKLILFIGIFLIITIISLVIIADNYAKNENLNIQSAPYIDKLYNNGVKVFLVDKPPFIKTNCPAIENWAKRNIQSDDSVIYFVKNNKDTSEASLSNYKDYEKEVDLNLLCEMTGEDKKCQECRD